MQKVKLGFNLSTRQILTGVFQVCQEFLPRMDRLSDLLIVKLSQYDGMPVVINDWCHFITFDTMGELGFGQSYGQLESGRSHEAIDQITKFLRVAVSAIQVPWLVNIIQSIPGLRDPQRLLRDFSARCLDEREKVSAIDGATSRPTRVSRVD